MSKNNKENAITIDRDTSQPQQKLIKKFKRQDNVVQNKNLTVKKEIGVQNTPLRKQQKNNAQVTSKQKAKQGKEEESEEEDDEENEEEEEDDDEEEEESDDNNKKKPLTIRKQKQNENNDKVEKEEETKSNNNNNKNDSIKKEDSPREYYNDSELKQLLKNLTPIKPETVDTEIQCELMQEQMTELISKYEIIIQEKDSEHKQTITDLENKFNLKEQEYISQLTHSKKETELEQTTKIQTISKLHEEITTHEKTIKQLSTTNNKLRKELTTLNQQVSTLFEQQTSPKQLLKPKEETKNLIESANNNSRTINKDKELQNSVNLVNILSNDNRKLRKILDTYGEYHKKIELSDKLKNKEQNIEQLNIEIKRLKSVIDKHKKCNDEKANYEKEIAVHKKENALSKERINVLRKEIAFLHRQNYSTHDHNNKKPILHSSASSCNLKSNISTPLNNSSNIINKKYILLSPSSFKDSNSLFNENELKVLSSYFESNEQYETFLKKIQILEKYRKTNEEKHNKSKMHLKDTISDKNEQIEYMQQKINENEMKLRISNNTIKDNKKTIKIYQKKINEQQKFIDTLLGNIKNQEKDSLKVNNELEVAKNELQEIKNKDKDKIIIDIDTMISKDKKYIEISRDNKLKEIDNNCTYKEDNEEIQNLTNQIEQPIKHLTQKEYIIALDSNEINKQNENEDNNVYEEQEEVIINEEQQQQGCVQEIKDNNDNNIIDS